MSGFRTPEIARGQMVLWERQLEDACHCRLDVIWLMKGQTPDHSTIADFVGQHGEPVRFDDEAAVAWDLVGGLCHLFGWSRASKLFVQIIRRITGPSYRWTSQDRAMAAMRALQDFNDRQETTYETIVATLRDMPVWAQARNHTLNN